MTEVLSEQVRSCCSTKPQASEKRLHPRNGLSHEVIQEVLVPVLVARHLHLVFGVNLVVHVVLLPLEPLSFLSQFGIFLFLFEAIAVSTTLHIHAVRTAISFRRKVGPTFSC